MNFRIKNKEIATIKIFKTLHFIVLSKFVYAYVLGMYYLAINQDVRFSHLILDEIFATHIAGFKILTESV